MAKATCAVDGCKRDVQALGWCKSHYYMLRPQKCSVDGCGDPLRARGLCYRHDRQKNGKPTRERLSKSKACAFCDESFRPKGSRSKFCSIWCKSQANRSPVRRAVEARDYAEVLRTVRESVVITDGGCWEWRFAKSNSRGYGVIGQGGSGGLVHRHVMAAKLGHPIGNQPVHHICANRPCCNPDHLQLVTERENTAEMLARNYFLSRIRELEEALAMIDPNNDALNAEGKYNLTALTITG